MAHCLFQSHKCTWDSVFLKYILRTLCKNTILVTLKQLPCDEFSAFVKVVVVSIGGRQLDFWSLFWNETINSKTQLWFRSVIVIIQSLIKRRCFIDSETSVLLTVSMNIIPHLFVMDYTASGLCSAVIAYDTWSYSSKVSTAFSWGVPEKLRFLRDGLEKKEKVWVGFWERWWEGEAYQYMNLLFEKYLTCQTCMFETELW